MKILTIPNLLTFSRLLMVPAFVWACKVRRSTALAVILLLLSALTDFLDGRIARRFNMVSSLGKILDPIADKVTQGTILICLLGSFPALWVPTALMVAKEAFVGITSLMTFKRMGRVEGAEMHGKIATAALDALVLIHLVWADIPGALSHALIGVTVALMLISLFLYGRKNLGILRHG